MIIPALDIDSQGIAARSNRRARHATQQNKQPSSSIPRCIFGRDFCTEGSFDTHTIPDLMLAIHLSQKYSSALELCRVDPSQQSWRAMFPLVMHFVRGSFPQEAQSAGGASPGTDPPSSSPPPDRSTSSSHAESNSAGCAPPPAASADIS